MKRLAWIALCLLAAGAHAQGSYPAKPVRLVVPFPPGGGVDVIGRVLAQKLTDAWKQQVLVDNRTGAGTTIGSEIVARAAPDGYTLLLTNSALAVTAGLYPRLRYDAGRDLVPVSELARAPYVLVVPASSPAKSVQELVALAKAKPGELAVANAGIGSGPHLAAVLFAIMTGTTVTHVPYKGAGPAIQDLAAGRIQAFFTGPLAAMPHVQAGRLRVLAVTSARRAAALPQVPTMAEGGVKGYDITTWYMLLAPARTPPPIIARVYRDAIAGLKQPDAAKIVGGEGVELVLSTPDESAALVRSELQRWASVIKQASLKPED